MRGWLLVLATTLLLCIVLQLVGAPAPALFAGLLSGLVFALLSNTSLAPPPWTFRAAQGMLGVIIGSQASASAMRQLVNDAPSIAVVTIGTILLSLGAGRLLALRNDVTTATGIFAMAAGGASGAIAIARDLGADDQVVGVVQYLRVLAVLLLMPVVATVLLDADTDTDILPEDATRLSIGLGFVAVSLAVGLLLTWWLSFPTAVLLGPLVVAATVSVVAGLGPVDVPAPVQWVAFAVFGIHVGLRFTRRSLRAMGRMLPVALAVIVVLIASTAGMGAALAALTPLDPMTAYLATSPGGLFAVSAIAADSGSDVTYVVAVQLVRLVAILALAPLVGWLLGRGRP
jgi:uncharacterized protein